MTIFPLDSPARGEYRGTMKARTKEENGDRERTRKPVSPPEIPVTIGGYEENSNGKDMFDL